MCAGRTLPREIHALVHWINAHAEGAARPDRAGQDPERTRCRLTVRPGARPRCPCGRRVGDARRQPLLRCPADLEFASHLSKVGFSLHLGRYADETAARSTWHIHQTHELESWSDLRSSDGTASLVQPLIRPLYDGWTEQQVISLLLGRDMSAYDLVRETWKSAAESDFDGWWRRALHDGVIAGKPLQACCDSSAPASRDFSRPRPSAGMTIVLRPDPSLWDGSLANNAWLQECPKPLTKQVWGNALALQSSRSGQARRHIGRRGGRHGGSRRIDIPVNIEPGVADGTAGITLGFGRSRAGRIGNGVGSNAYDLRSAPIPGSFVTRRSPRSAGATRSSPPKTWCVQRLTFANYTRYETCPKQ